MEASAWVGKVLEALKLSTVPALAIGFVSGLLLFARDTLIAALGMTSFVTEWRPWIGLAFLFSAALLVARASASFGGWIRKRWTWWVNGRNRRARLHSLAPDEKEVLSRFLLERRRCLPFPMNDGISQGLAAADILFRSSLVGDALRGFDFTMEPWVWDYLNKHPTLVIRDPAKLTLLLHRTVRADLEGFDGDGEPPWAVEEESRQNRGRWKFPAS